MDETPEERLRGALSSIISRGETIMELGSPFPLPSIARAMMTDAIEALSEAYPEDRLYRDRLDDWRAKWND